MRPALMRNIVVLGIWIGGPPTLSLLFGEAVGLEKQPNAIVGLGVLGIVAAIHYRQKLDALLRSSFVVIALIAACVGAIVYYYFRPTAPSPIVIYGKANDFLTEAALRKHIRKSEHEVWFYGANFHVSAPEIGPDLMEALKNGVNIRYLVFDFTCPLASEIAHHLGETLPEFESESRKGILGIQRAQREWRKIRGDSDKTLEVKLHCHVPGSRAYFFDPRSSEGITYLVPYGARVSSASTPGLLALENRETNFVSYFRSVFQRWNDSDSIELWLRAHPEHDLSLVEPEPRQ